MSFYDSYLKKWYSLWHTLFSIYRVAALLEMFQYLKREKNNDHMRPGKMAISDDTIVSGIYSC